IEASSGLNEAEIQRLIKDAETHASEDRERKEAVESRNRADALVYEVEKNLKEHGGKLDSATKSRVESDGQRLRDALKGQDTDAIRAATDSLEQAWHAAAAEMYKAAGSASQPTGEAQAGPEETDAGKAESKKKPGSGGAVDADYEVVE